MAVVVLGPILVLFALWLLTREQSQTASAALLCLSGASGVLACGYGIVAVEPFFLPTNAFFMMVATFDTFSAMFFFPFALIVAALGMRFGMQRVSAPRTHVQIIGAALLVIGVTWVMFSTNILGIAAALIVMVCGEACLASFSVRAVVLRSIGILSIATGLFILSSGALFNDFSTLAYIAAELDPARLIGAFAAVFFGVTILAGGWPFTRFVSRQMFAMPSKAERALVRAAYVIVPLYILIRTLLFILPPLTLWYAVPVGAIGVLTIRSAMHFASKQRSCAETTFVVGAGAALFMLSAAMTFQALGLFEAMNVALFATLLHIVGVVIAGGTEEYAPNKGAIERTVTGIALSALPPSVCFVSIWMFVSGIVVQQSALPRPLALWFVLGTLFLLATYGKRGYAVISDLRSTLSRVDQPGSFTRDPSFLLLATASTVGALFIPFIFFIIGAVPLTLGAETWQGAVVSGDGMLSTAILLLSLVVLSGGIWLVRDRTAHMAIQGVAEATSIQAFPETRMIMLRREIYKTAVQHVAAPVREYVQQLRTWHERHAATTMSPILGLMVLTVILTLAIAL